MERAREWIERALLLDPENINMRYNFAWLLGLLRTSRMAALDLLEPMSCASTPYRDRLRKTSIPTSIRCATIRDFEHDVARRRRGGSAIERRER